MTNPLVREGAPWQKSCNCQTEQNSGREPHTIFINLVTQCLEVLLGYHVPGGNKYRNLALQVGGGSKIGTVKYAHEFRRAQT
jgi:hypothetical protein